jgi:hypothetical protein
LGFSELIEQHLTDPRQGKHTQFPLAGLLRYSEYGRLAGYEDLDDAERVFRDPTFRLIGSVKIWDRGDGLDLALAAGTTSAAGSGRERCRRTRPDVLNWSAGKRKRRFRPILVTPHKLERPGREEVVHEAHSHHRHPLRRARRTSGG